MTANTDWTALQQVEDIAYFKADLYLYSPESYTLEEKRDICMKLARQQCGRVATKDVMSLLHLGRKQAYRQLKKLESEGALELKKRGAYSYYAVVD